MAAIACVTPSPHRVVHNDGIQIYEKPPAQSDVDTLWLTGPLLD